MTGIDPWAGYVPPPTVAPRPVTHRRVCARDAAALDVKVRELGHDLAGLDTGYDQGTFEVYALVPLDPP